MTLPLAASTLPLLRQAASGLAGATRLQDWGVIQAQGEDARSFLHGQLTQDVQALPMDRWRLAGYCSAKGRLLATFVIWSPERDTVFLACSRDLLPAVLKRLSMFVLRARCKLSDVSADRPVWGVLGASPAPGQMHTTANANVLGLEPVEGVTRALWVGSEASSVPTSPDVPEAAQLWPVLEVASAQARITLPNSEQFVPQMVNLEVTQGVHFQKGCYPGQEVVARSQYRGTLKRRMVRMVSTLPLEAGQDVFHVTDPEQPAGRVVLSASAPGGVALSLVEVKLDALSDPLGFTAGGQAVAVLDPALPYPLPAQA